MKKIFLVVVVGVFFVGCGGGDTEIPKQEITYDQARILALETLESADGYTDRGGYHPEVITSEALECMGCYDFYYEFRLRENSEDPSAVTGVAEAIVNIREGVVTNLRMKTP